MNISSAYIDNLKKHISISKVVGSRIKLKTHGKEYMGLCPFHEERTPSFTVNNSKGFFHCFGCGAHGDAIAFVEKFDRLSKIDAINRLAIEAGVALPKAVIDKEPPKNKSEAIIEGLFAFVLMPFSSEFDDIYKLGIKESAKQLGIRAERVDEQIYSEGILERIYRQIDLADIIIADMTGQNANVFYEVGYAHAKEKLCILLTSNAEDIPFDLKHKRHIIYGQSIVSLQKSMLDELAWAKKEKEKIKESRIKLTPNDIATELETSKYFAEAHLYFKVDLHNESTKASPEIEAAYLFSGSNWKVFQDGKECASSKADPNTKYPLCHFLNVPIRKLRKGQWAQLVFQAKKRVWNGFSGELLKDNYKISEKAMIRVATAENDFDYEIPIDVNVSNIPF